MPKQQIPLIGELNPMMADNPDLSSANPTLQFNQNGFYQKVETNTKSEAFTFNKRPGIDSGTQLLTVTPGAAFSLLVASYSQEENPSLFQIYTDNVNWSCFYNTTAEALPGSWTMYPDVGADIVQLGQAGGIYGPYEWAFTDFNQGGLYNTATGVISEITDVDYVAIATVGSSQLSNMVAIDGFLLQANTVNNRIYNSVVNNPASWAATSYIAANKVPGRIIKLEKVRNYLVAFKTHSIEFFENVGNPTPGSPFDSRPSLHRNYGAFLCNWVKSCSKGIIWVGRDPAGSPGVFVLDRETLVISEVSTPGIKALLGQSPFASEENNRNYDQHNTSGCCILTFDDKELFLFTPGNGSNYGNVGGSLVYDLDLGVWGLWITQDIYNCILSNKGATQITNTFVNWRETNRTFAIFNPEAFQDTDKAAATTPIAFKWVSDIMDFGNSERKFQGSMEVSYYTNRSSSLPSVNLQYQDFGTANSTTATSVAKTATAIGTNRLKWWRLGSFFKRRYIISSTSNAPLRIGVVEVDLDVDPNASD